MDKIIASMEAEYDTQALDKRISDIQELIKTEDDAKLVNIVTPSGVTVSSEGFKEALLARASSLRGSVWGNFMDGLDNSRAQAENRLNRITHIRRIADDIKYDGGAGSVNVSELYKNLEIRGKVPDGSELIKALRHLGSIVNNELHDEMDFLLAATDRMSNDIDSLLRTVGTTTEVSPLSRRLGSIGDIGDLIIRRRNTISYLSHDIGSEGKYTYNSSELLGNVKLVSTGGSYNNTNIKSQGLMQFRAIASIFEMRTSIVSTSTDYIAQNTVSQLSERELYQALDIIEKMLSDIIRFRLRYGTRFSKEKRRFTGYRDKLNNLGRNGDNVEHKVYLRRTADVANSISRWIHTPAMPLIGHTLKVVTATLSYITSSVAINRASVK